MRLIDIAKALRVSHATVSRALNPEKQHLISKRTRDRIRQYAETRSFVPNRAARDLVTGRTQTLGVLLPTVFNSLFFNEQLARTLAGIYQVLGRNNRYTCKLVILPTEKSFERLDELALSAGVDGLLVSAQYDHFSKKAPYLPGDFLARWKKPFVLINVALKDAVGVNAVSFDNEEAAYQAVTYLIKKGHQEIALIYGEDKLRDSRERFDGYVRALKDHHRPVRASLRARGHYTFESGYQALLALSAVKTARPTAVFCTNDEMAMGAISAIKSLRRRCPQDLAVMGFDGIETGNFVEPRLTSVRQPSLEIAAAGTQLLINLIEGRVKGRVQKIIPTDITVRDSA